MGSDEDVQLSHEKDSQTLSETKTMTGKQELHHVKGAILKFAKAMKKIDEEPVDLPSHKHEHHHKDDEDLNNKSLGQKEDKSKKESSIA